MLLNSVIKYWWDPDSLEGKTRSPYLRNSSIWHQFQFLLVVPLLCSLSQYGFGPKIFLSLLSSLLRASDFYCLFSWNLTGHIPDSGSVLDSFGPRAFSGPLPYSISIRALTAESASTFPLYLPTMPVFKHMRGMVMEGGDRACAGRPERDIWCWVSDHKQNLLRRHKISLKNIIAYH